MEDNKHTPGPWTCCKDGDCSCKQVWGAHFPIAVVTAGDWGDDYPALRLVGTSTIDANAEAYMEQITYGSVSEEMARANARLIAAAPTMYLYLQNRASFGDTEAAEILEEIHSPKPLSPALPLNSSSPSPDAS